MRGSKAGTRWLGLFLCTLAAVLLFAVPASAHKTHLFLETFGSANQPEFHGSTALAVDQSSGDLLVADDGPGTISRFKPNGEPDPFPALGTNVIDAKKGEGGKACAEEPASCDQTPQNGFSFGGFAGEAEVAIDNSGTATDGDIYVTQFKGFVDVFAPDGHYLGQLTAAGAAFEHICGVAVDPGGNVFLAEYGKLFVEEHESKIYKFVQPGSPHNPLANADGATLATTTEEVCDLAAGAGPSAGALFAGAFFSNSGNGVLKFNAASGSFEGVIAPSTQDGVVLSVDPLSGHLFAEGRSSGGRELTASGTLVSTFGTGGRGIAIDGAADRVYSSSSSDSGGQGPEPSIRVYGPLVTLPDVSTGGYEIKGDTSVRAKGTVNPDGEALSECFFEYDTTQYIGEYGSHGQKAPCEAPDAAEVGAGAGPVEVHADLSGLESETLYHYRLVATNPNAALYPDAPEAVVKGADQTFKTPSVPAIKGIWATNVVTTDATLKATLNPENSPTTYRFEWGLDSSYGQSTAEIGIGSDGADHTVGFNLSGLEPATTYHYRVVATNGIGVSESADRHFTTFALPSPGAECENDASRIGFGTLLPDCRAYEMVSPLDKASGDIHLLETTLAELAVLEQASLAGDKLAYGSYRSFGGDASAPYTSQYIAQRIPGLEWRTHPIDSPLGRSFGVIGALDTEFGAFSADLCEGWKTNFAEATLAEGALEGFPNLYRRTDELCSEDGAVHYEALAPNMQLLPNFQLLGVSADGSQAIFTVGVALGERQLYESIQGSSPRFVCVLPDGAPLSGTCAAGTKTGGGGPAAQIGRISADGERVFWAAGDGEAKLYLRLNPDQPESARLHGAASGKGDLIGPAAGAGNVINGSALVKGAKAESGAFAVGQKISDSGGAIPAATTIVKIEETGAGVFTLTLSAAAKATKLGDPLTGAASEKVSGILTETGAFEAGQEISAPGIPPAATVISCSPACGPEATSITLSVKATKTEPGANLSATSPCTEAATKACTIPVSAAAEEAQGTSTSWFWGAAADGSKAIFSTGNLSGGAATLYEFDVDGEGTTPIAAGVLGVMGISDDAKRVYFASSKVLSGEEENSNGDKAQAGKANLYLHEAGGGTVFIGTLAEADKATTIHNGWYLEHTALIASDGLHAAFASFAPLSGYDNTEAAEDDCEGVGKGDACREIYRYDAELNQLLCVSCNPSGARPAGQSEIPFWETGLHAARVLSDDGTRLYFESGDALTPRDTNGRVDVYQWEEAGAGGCEEADPGFSHAAQGCVDLISSGQNPQDSRFVEADPSGANVFIATASSLLPQDPGGVDIYDARANGGLPIPQGPPPSCEGEACQGVIEAPNDPTPASLSFEGAGNVREEPAAQRPKPCAKGKVKRHGKCVAKKHAAKKHKRAKRHRRAGR